MNRWLFDDKLLEEVRRYFIYVIVTYNMALEVFEFLQSWKLQINLLHSPLNVGEDVSEAELGLFELTNKNSKTNITISTSTTMSLLSNPHGTSLFIGTMCPKKTIPIEMMKHFQTINLDLDLDPLSNEQEIDYDSYFAWVAYFIEYILTENDNNKEKKLIIATPSMEPEFFNFITQKIHDEFEHREHFQNIILRVKGHGSLSSLLSLD